jgi:cytochrome bd-type quinol oxidase subunit 1
MTPVNVLLDRWQFGVTIVYHFQFVPLTIGLAFLVAIMQVQAYRTRDETWDRLTRFFGTLFLINFAMGVVTGIVPGVPVRHELVELLGVRGQHLRCPAGF